MGVIGAFAAAVTIISLATNIVAGRSSSSRMSSFSLLGILLGVTLSLCAVVHRLLVDVHHANDANLDVFENSLRYLTLLLPINLASIASLPRLPRLPPRIKSSPRDHSLSRIAWIAISILTAIAFCITEDRTDARWYQWLLPPIMITGPLFITTSFPRRAALGAAILFMAPAVWFPLSRCGWEEGLEHIAISSTLSSLYAHVLFFVLSRLLSVVVVTLSAVVIAGAISLSVRTAARIFVLWCGLCLAAVIEVGYYVIWHSPHGRFDFGILIFIELASGAMLTWLHCLLLILAGCVLSLFFDREADGEETLESKK